LDLGECALGAGDDLLVADWRTLVFAGVIYDRDSVERGSQLVPIGQLNPLRFVFGVDRQLDGNDLSAIRGIVQTLIHAKGTAVDLRMTEDKEILVLEGRGPTTEAGGAAAFLGLMRETIRGELAGFREENRQDHDQKLIMLARQSAENEPLIRFVKSLYLQQVECRTDEEVERFEGVVHDMSLGDHVTFVGRAVRFAKAFVATPEALEAILKFVQLDGVLKALRAGTMATKALGERDRECKAQRRGADPER
jgi:hypothetical protein